MLRFQRCHQSQMFLVALKNNFEGDEDLREFLLSAPKFGNNNEVADNEAVEITNKIADMVEIVEVIPDTGGIPFSPRIKSDDGQSYLDCPRVVTDLVYTKAKDWYGEPLPYSIEERIATELYGDIVLKAVKEKRPNHLIWSFVFFVVYFASIPRV